MLRISDSVDGASVAPGDAEQRARARSASPALVENAASTDATPNAAAPISSSRRRPMRSPSVPIVISNPATQEAVDVDDPQQLRAARAQVGADRAAPPGSARSGPSSTAGRAARSPRARSIRGVPPCECGSRCPSALRSSVMSAGGPKNVTGVESLLLVPSPEEAHQLLLHLFGRPLVAKLARQFEGRLHLRQVAGAGRAGQRSVSKRTRSAAGTV